MAILTVQQRKAGAIVVPASFALTDTLTATDSVSVVAGSPLLLEDFSTYTSTANWIADPRGIYSVTEDVNTGFMQLDTSQGLNVGGYSLTQCGRYNWPDRSGEGTTNGLDGYCGDDTIGRNLSLPSHQTELWVEVWFKTDSTFKTLAPAGWNCHSAAAYKCVFLRTDVSRYNLVLGIFGETSSYTWSAGPGNQEPADYPLTWTPFDGSWHQYQMHVKIGSGANGICNLAVDGVVKQTNTGLSQGSASYIYGIAIGRNMNQGPAQTQSEYWGRIAAYTSDPWSGLI